MGDEKIQIIATARDQASAQLKMLRGNVAALGTATTGPLGGMGAGLLAAGAAGFASGAGFQMLTGALQGAGEWLGKGAKSAIDEEKQIAILGQTIKDNVPNWNGYTEAVNAQLQSMMKLGFTDDDLRTAFGHLIVQTHDLGEGFRELNIATDLAHARNMDLTDAADLVNKAVLGNSRALRQLGIDATGAKTGVERLALIEKAFAGSTAAYLTTTAGKIDVANIKMSELQEQVGGTMMPLIAQFASTASDEIDNVSGAFSGLTAAGQQFYDMLSGNAATPMVGDSIPKGIAAAIGTQDWGNAFAALNTQMKKEGYFAGVYFGQSAAEGIGGGAPTIADAIGSMFGKAVDSASSAAAKDAAAFGDNFTDDLAGSLRGNKSVVSNAMDDLMWAIKHPMALEKQAARIEAALTSRAMAQGLASNNPMIQAVAVQQYNTLTGQWQLLTNSAWNKGANAADALEAGLRTFNIPNIFNSIFGGGGNSRNPGIGGGAAPRRNRAAGGDIDPYGWSVVGERGPELIHVGRRGASVTPNHQLGHGHDIYLDGEKVGRAQDRYQGRLMALSPSSSYSRG